MNSETSLMDLVWVTSIICIILVYGTTWFIMADRPVMLWVRLATIIIYGALIEVLTPELVRVFTSTGSHFVCETVKSSREGGANLNILSGLVAGNMSGC